MDKEYTARDVLTYMYAEGRWKEDVDGDCVDGVIRTHVWHHIEIDDGLLDELLDMAGIPHKQGETCISALSRANDEDQNKALAENKATG